MVDPSSLRYPRQVTRNAVALFFYLQGVCFGSWASRIPDLKDTLHLSEGDLGSILFFLPLGQLTMMPFSGRITTRFGTRNVYRIALLFYAGALYMIGMVEQSWHLGLCLYLFGLSGNLCNISINTQGVNTESLFEKPFFSTLHGLWSLGGFTGGLMGLLMMRNSWSPALHFMIVALLVIFSVFFFQRFLIPKNAVSSSLPKYQLKVPDILLLQLGLIAFCCMSVEGCMFDWTGVYFKDIIRVDERFITSGYTAFMITMAGGRFLGDRLSIAFGRNYVVKASGELIFAGLMIIIVFPYLTTGIIGCMITGFGVSSIVPLVYTTAGKDPKISSSIAIATVAGIGYMGFLIGPPLIGHIAEAIGLPYSFLVMATGGIAINLIVRRIKEII